MKNQAKNQQQETHGKTTNSMINKDKKEEENTTLLSPKTGLLA